MRSNFPYLVRIQEKYRIKKKIRIETIFMKKILAEQVYTEIIKNLHLMKLIITRRKCIKETSW